MNNLKTESRGRALKRLIAFLFFLFIIALIWVIVFKCNRNDHLWIERNLSHSLRERFTYSIIPFKEDLQQIAAGSVVELLALIFNVVCFLPFGVLLSFLISKKATILLGFAFSSAVEIFQLFSGWGGFDFMDILLNTLGAVIGVVLYEYFFSKLSDKAIGTIAYVCLALILPFNTYAIVNTILNFPI